MSLEAYPRISDWITVQNGRLLIRTGKVDIGQRISTALIQIVHEELTTPPERIDIAPVRTGYAPDEGITSGSNSIENSGHALRCAAATLRSKSIALASSRLGGAEEDWHLLNATLCLSGTNHQIDIMDLIVDIALEARVDPNVSPQPRGKDALPHPKMRGLEEMVRGKFTYIQDLDFPGMQHARIIRPPHVNARLRGIDQSAIGELQALGFFVIHDGSFIALVGPREWPLVKGTSRLAAACDWDHGGGLPETNIFEHLNATHASRFAVIDGVPSVASVPDALKSPNHAARFERPYLMHGSLAPSAAAANWTGQKLNLHSQSQGIYPLRASIADSLDLEENQVEITHVPGSGCYGHSGADDATFEAALIAMALPNKPILLKWTREDEHSWEPYGPAMAVELAATLAAGKIARFSADTYSDTHRGRPRSGANRSGPAKLLANRFRSSPIGPKPAMPNMGWHAGMHRNLDPIYDFDEKRLIKNLVSGLPHRTSALRCLGAAANIFAIESFMDELACRQGADPIDFRRFHLNDPRADAMLAEMGKQIKTRPELASGCGRGVAYAQYKNQMTRIGVCVELEVNDRAEIHLMNVDIVADAGRVIDEEGLTAQLEGGCIQAASWALYEQVIWDRDGILSRDWDSYPVIRFDNIPTINVTILDRPDMKSVGAGEASPGPVLAAIANAVFDATGLRMRRMPFTPDAIRKCAVEM